MSWHLLFYTFTDNELETWSFQDIAKLSASSNLHGVKITMLLDTANLGSYLISIDSPHMTMKRLPNQNMSNPNTLKDFINNSICEHPAVRYGLILQGHGSGWFLRTEKDSIMPIPVLAKTLQETNIIFDLLCFDNCMMSNFESLYTMKNNVRYVIAYEDYAGMNGFAQSSNLDLFDPKEKTRDISVKVAKNLINILTHNDDPTDVSVICISSLEKLATFLKNKKLTLPIDNSFCVEPEYWHLQDLYSIVKNSNVNQREFSKLFKNVILYYSQSINKNNITHHGLSCIVEAEKDTYDVEKSYRLLDILLSFT